jgi:HPt (histidine-containing phosphotransfer) domain-containing protein
MSEHSPEPPSPAVPPAPVLDIEAGVERLMGERTIYLRALARFRSSYRDSAGAIRRALDAADTVLAHRLAHTLKGAAGMIEAPRLHVAALVLEATLRDGSGMFILNPPYTLEPMLREVLPYLVKVLGKDSGATFVIERGTQVTGAASARVGAGGTARQPIGNARRASPLSGTGSLRLPGQAAVPRAEAAEVDVRLTDDAAASKVGASARAKRFSRQEGAAPAASPAPRARYADERPKTAGARPERAASGRPASGRPVAAGSGRPAAGNGPARPRKRT